jgi:hypothetical protein
VRDEAAQGLEPAGRCADDDDVSRDASRRHVEPLSPIPRGAARIACEETLTQRKRTLIGVGVRSSSMTGSRETAAATSQCPRWIGCRLCPFGDATHRCP